MKLLDSCELLSTQISSVFKNALRLELPYIPFKIKSLPLVKLQSSVLTDYLTSGQNSESLFWSGNGDSGPILWEWHPCFVSRVLVRGGNLWCSWFAFSDMNFHPMSKLRREQSVLKCSQPAVPVWSFHCMSGGWVEEGIAWLFVCIHEEFNFWSLELGEVRNSGGLPFWWDTILLIGSWGEKEPHLCSCMWWTEWVMAQVPKTFVLTEIC